MQADPHLAGLPGRAGIHARVGGHVRRCPRHRLARPGDVGAPVVLLFGRQVLTDAEG